jgi:hypothetical protein
MRIIRIIIIIIIIIIMEKLERKAGWKFDSLENEGKGIEETNK